MKNIRLLEKRVHQAVERLRQLSEERRRLEEELETLRCQVEQAPAASSDGGAEREWAGERVRIATLVREALSELTAD